MFLFSAEVQEKTNYLDVVQGIDETPAKFPIITYIFAHHKKAVFIFKNSFLTRYIQFPTFSVFVSQMLSCMLD